MNKGGWNGGGAAKNIGASRGAMKNVGTAGGARKMSELLGGTKTFRAAGGGTKNFPQFWAYFVLFFRRSLSKTSAICWGEEKNFVILCGGHEQFLGFRSFQPLPLFISFDNSLNHIMTKTIYD